VGQARGWGEAARASAAEQELRKCVHEAIGEEDIHLQYDEDGEVNFDSIDVQQVFGNDEWLDIVQTVKTFIELGFREKGTLFKYKDKQAHAKNYARMYYIAMQLAQVCDTLVQKYPQWGTWFASPMESAQPPPARPSDYAPGTGNTDNKWCSYISWTTCATAWRFL
jgi:hypothetical protein